MDELNNKTSTNNKSDILNGNSNHNSITKPFFYSILSMCFAILGFIIFAIAIMGNVFIGFFVKYSFLLSAIFGIIALAKIRHYKSKPLVKYVAIISVSLSICCLLLILHTYDISDIRTEARHIRNVGYIRIANIGASLIRYSNNHDGYLPDANQWCDLLIENDSMLKKEDFKHPYIKGFECNFAFNKNLSGLRIYDIPSDVVLVFNADGGWNLNGTEELLKDRGMLRNYILLADNEVYIPLDNNELYPYSFIYKGIYTHDSNSSSTPIKQLRWEP
jgi:hypothetical protein